MAEKKASLTVLGGALAGTRFLLEDAGPEVVLGADPACHFQLAMPGVSPQHARLHIGPTAVTIEDAGSDRGLHVNDGRVVEPTLLHNGDIVWLGTPGEADVVMLQCILPPRAAPPAVVVAPAPALSEDETLALALAQSEEVPAATQVMEAPLHVEDEAATSEYSPEPEPATVISSAADYEFTEEPPPPTGFEDETHEPAFIVDDDQQGTVAMDSPVYGQLEPTMALPPVPGYEPSQTLVMPEAEPTVMMGTPAPVPTPPPTEMLPRQAAPPPPPPAAARPPAPPPKAPRPPAAAPAARKPAPSPRPQPQPRAEKAASAPAPEARGPKSKSNMPLLAGLGVLGLLVVVGGLWAARSFMGGGGKATPPTTVATAIEPPPATPAPPVGDPPPSAAPIVEPTPEPPAPATPEPVPSAAAATPPPPSTTLKSASPSPSPSPRVRATPTPAAAPAGPSPEQLRAQQVTALLGQAEAALAGGQLDQAISQLDEVLKLEPGHPKATADRATAVSRRDASRKKFVVGRTVVKTEKAQDALAGFEGAEVQRKPDFSGRIEFEMSPASVKTGDAWTLKFYLVNDGKKGIKIGGLTAQTVVNGTGSGGPVTPGSREVAPQQRVLLGQLSGSWPEGTTSWQAEVVVSANRGDSLRNSIVWR